MEIKSFRKYLLTKAGLLGLLYLVLLVITLVRGQSAEQRLYELAAITMMFCVYVVIEIQVIIPERVLLRKELIESRGRRLLGLLIPLAIPFVVFSLLRAFEVQVLNRAVWLAIVSQFMLFYVVIRSEDIVRYLNEGSDKGD